MCCVPQRQQPVEEAVLRQLCMFLCGRHVAQRDLALQTQQASTPTMHKEGMREGAKERAEGVHVTGMALACCMSVHVASLSLHMGSCTLAALQRRCLWPPPSQHARMLPVTVPVDQLMSGCSLQGRIHAQSAVHTYTHAYAQLWQRGAFSGTAGWLGERDVQAGGRAQGVSFFVQARLWVGRMRPRTVCPALKRPWCGVRSGLPLELCWCSLMRHMVGCRAPLLAYAMPTGLGWASA